MTPSRITFSPTRFGSVRQRPDLAGPQATPPASPEPGTDSLNLSPEAWELASGEVPDAVSAAVADLQGDATAMAADFRTIGDYFAAHGEFPAQDAFMRTHFTQAQLQAFPPPTEGFIHPPPRSAPLLPEALRAAVADIQGSQASLGRDLKAIGDYFRQHGGREAHRAFMRTTFTEAQREAIHQYHLGSQTEAST